MPYRVCPKFQRFIEPDVRARQLGSRLGSEDYLVSELPRPSSTVNLKST
jgi:hypothetical protein